MSYKKRVFRGKRNLTEKDVTETKQGRIFKKGMVKGNKYYKDINWVITDELEAVQRKGRSEGGRRHGLSKVTSMRSGES